MLRLRLRQLRARFLGLVQQGLLASPRFRQLISCLERLPRRGRLQPRDHRLEPGQRPLRFVPSALRLRRCGPRRRQRLVALGQRPPQLIDLRFELPAARARFRQFGGAPPLANRDLARRVLSDVAGRLRPAGFVAQGGHDGLLLLELGGDLLQRGARSRRG